MALVAESVAAAVSCTVVSEPASRRCRTQRGPGLTARPLFVTDGGATSLGRLSPGPTEAATGSDSPARSHFGGGRESSEKENVHIKRKSIPSLRVKGSMVSVTVQM